MFKRTVCILLVVALGLVAAPAFAGKKKPKPYKSEEVSTGIPHPVGHSASGDAQSVTANEFRASCSEPSSNGLDGYVFAIPKDYQKIQASVDVIGSNAGSPASYDLDIYMYDASCALKFFSNTVGTDESTVMPAGIAWAFVHNYAGEPGTMAHIELRPYKG